MSSPADTVASTAPRFQAEVTASAMPSARLITTTASGPSIDGLRAGQQPRQHVPALDVEAEQVTADRADELQRGVGDGRVVRRDQRAEDRRERGDGDDGRGDDPGGRRCPRSRPAAGLRIAASDRIVTAVMRAGRPERDPRVERRVEQVDDRR